MTSILKVDNIKDSADNQAISISGGVVTFASAMGGSGANLTSLPVLGNGQTWQSVTRAVGTTYTNSTGRTIFLSICFSGSTGNITLTTGGVAHSAAISNATQYPRAYFYLPVVAGDTYVLSNNSTSVVTWFELR
jgi:hypothetical protein